MPPRKKQRTDAESSAAAQEHDSQEETSTTPHKNDENDKNNKNDKDDKSDEQELPKRDTKSIPNDEYVVVPRPMFDYEAENWARETEAVEREDVFEEYMKMANEEIEKNVVFQPAKDFPGRKWVILWEAWKYYKEYQRRAAYCCPDRFGMHIYTDFEGYGQIELVENMVNDFQTALNKKNSTVGGIWVIVSGLCLWLVETELGPLMGADDGDRVGQLIDLVGHVLLRGLTAIDRAGELKPDGKFLDVPIVITSMLEWSNDFPDYGFEGKIIDWRAHAAAYFKKGKYDASQGITTAQQLVEEVEGVDEGKIPAATKKDPWGWKQTFQLYKCLHAVPCGRVHKIGGFHYDITRMTRAQRAQHAFDDEDPLKDVSDKDLREGNLCFE